MMTDDNNKAPGPGSRHLNWLSLLMGACLLLVLAGIFLPRWTSPSQGDLPEKTGAVQASAPAAQRAETIRTAPRPIMSAADAQRIVSTKLTQFAQNRLAVVRTIAQKHGTEVPGDMTRFFELVGEGNFDEAKRMFETLQEERQKMTGAEAEARERFWPALQETFLIASCAHDWPPQELLTYGRAVLENLRPGMVYLGGTDSGRGIPTLLNDTSDDDRNIILTQNAFADASYLEYVNTLYGDRLKTLTGEDSQRAFQDYLADAQKRLDHDLQFPNEPKQLRPGEDVKRTDNRVQVSGQVAVMAINEKLLQTLMTKNPDVTFALEESFPMKSTYADAVPLGPIMELRAPNAQTAFTADIAAQSADRWNELARTLQNNADVPADSNLRQAYSKLATSQGGLLADHGFQSQAEQAYRAAVQIAPTYPEAVFRCVNLLLKDQRTSEAIPIVETAVSGAPDNQMFRDLLANLKSSQTPR